MNNDSSDLEAAQVSSGIVGDFVQLHPPHHAAFDH